MTQYAALMESRSLEADNDDDFERDWKGINPCDLDFLFYGVRMGTFVSSIMLLLSFNYRFSYRGNCVLH